MSEKPPFDVDTSVQIITPPRDVTKSEIHVRQLGTIQDDPLECPHCKNKFKNKAGIASHIKNKHNHLDDVYSSDIIRMLIKKQGPLIYDKDTGNWIYSVKISLPKDFVLYKIIRDDVVHNISEIIDHKASFMSILAVRKDRLP